MSELKYIQFQPIDSSSDDIDETHRQPDEIVLDNEIDESTLDSYWDKVVQDIHQDPDWFTFSDE